jgi:hypothetical protein
MATRGRARPGRRRGFVRELTTVRVESKKSPGKRCGRRIDDGGDEAEAAMGTMGAMFCCSLPCVRRREREVRDGGALGRAVALGDDGGHASEARRRRVALGWLREREGEEEE